ncbi:ribosome-associated ATPase/putative transporter RbbA [Rhizobium sp. FY34]|uniref:ribosome-associated ATPase/putative transporter RbbA n=1 Tax=Rhizobium sp. FY34 TaxID=2562309 RepID=UPI0010C01FA0|nr:ribosome-associated ATPase/putative transporter RbbA [Rhizobium sp. FY34]
MAAEPETVVRLSAVTHRYGDVDAISKIDLNVPSGRMVSFIGPDGAGKSTLLGLISGVRKAQVGEIEVLGGDMRSSRHRNRVCRRIAYMPQGLGKNLYQEISVRDNLHFFGKLFGQDYRERDARITRLAGATGLSPFLDRPAGKLSGGMKQKLGLCCALIHDPDLLILDEPTTGVDPLSRRQFWTLIEELRGERPEMSVIFSTAYMDEAEQCDWIAAVDDGRILASGTLGELRAKTGRTDLEEVFVALQAGDGAPSAEKLVIPAFKDELGEPIIRARNLTCRFGDFTAVSDVSFDIAKGEIFGFLGSNGCGKTTTMRMLTGLLAPSDGVAEIYGHPVDANDLSTRRRVGFMSQAFSLYSELTVRQNLVLHARLYHLPTPDERAQALIAQFDLADHADQEAGDLPLGLRQRLSLAVAVVHDPQLLILDEPTSGVDPQARDAFWRILADLSRQQKVTIFVSTHFMNEAMRCDRISLMHAGHVLICDTPQNVLAASGEEELEKAFVSFIEKATGTKTEPEAQTAPEILSTKPPGRNPVRDSWRRILAWSNCETLALARDPVRVAFAFFGSLILLLIFSYGTSSDVTDLSFAVYDRDQTADSRDYLSNFQGSRYFIEKSPIHSAQEMDARLKAADITLALEIPEGFGRDVKTNGSWQVSAWIDGANTLRSATIESYVEQAHSTWASGLSSADALGNFSMLNRHRYNPTSESIYAMGPSVPAILLMLFLAILMAVSVTREKEIGTITNFYVTPTRRLEFLVGKQLPYIAIGLINFAVMTATVIFVFDVPLKGSGLALTIGALLYSIAALGFGLLVSTFTTNQVSAVFVAAVLALLPTIQFSGMLQPVSTLEGSARLMGSIWPTTYYMQMSVGAFTKGLSLSSMVPQLLVMAIFGPVFLFTTALFLKKQEA